MRVERATPSDLPAVEALLAAAGLPLEGVAEALARDLGVRELYLLTETAADWFPRLGYEVVDREEARTAVGESVEFTMVCATTGVPMRRPLAHGPDARRPTGVGGPSSFA